MVSTESVTILGIAHDHPGERQYNFIRVVARLQDGVLERVVNPAREFPKKGDVWVGVPSLPTPNAAVICDVLYRGKGDNAYAVRKVRLDEPHEFIAVPVKLSDPDALREVLLRGVRMRHRPANSCLFITVDGKAVGPLHPAFESSTGGYTLVRCKQDELVLPVGYWDNVELLDPIDAEWGVAPRRYAGRLHLPDRSGVVDLADVATSVGQLLRSLKKSKAIGLTSQQISDRAEAVSGASVPDDLTARRARIDSILRDHVRFTKSAQEITHQLLDLPEIQEALEREKHDELERYRAELEGQEQEIKKSLSALKTKLAARRRELDESEKKIAAAAQEREEELVKIEKAIETTLARAEADAAELYARSALLRPLLSSRKADQTSAADAPLLRSRDCSIPDAAPATSLSEALSAAEQNLANNGLGKPGAHALAVGVGSALLAGQVPMLLGPGSASLALQVGRALCASDISLVPVPAGLTSSAELDALIDEAAQRSNARGHFCLLILDGLNNSAPEFYAGALERGVFERQSLPGGAPGVIATLSGGLTALPVSTHYLNFGPLFDLRYAPFKWKNVAQPVLPHQISLSDWTSWAQSTPGTGRPPEELFLRGLLGRDRYWEQLCTRAFQALEPMTDAPLDVVALGWSAQRAALQEVEHAEVVAELESAGVKLESQAGRWVKAILGRAADGE